MQTHLGVDSLSLMIEELLLVMGGEKENFLKGKFVRLCGALRLGERTLLESCLSPQTLDQINPIAKVACYFRATF